MKSSRPYEMSILRWRIIILAIIIAPAWAQNKKGESAPQHSAHNTTRLQQDQHRHVQHRKLSIPVAVVARRGRRPQAGARVRLPEVDRPAAGPRRHAAEIGRRHLQASSRLR